MELRWEKKSQDVYKMPQLDLLTFINQYIWVTLGFVSMYCLGSLFFSPLNFKIIKVRQFFNSNLGKRRLFYIYIVTLHQNLYKYYSYKLILQNSFFQSKFNKFLLSRNFILLNYISTKAHCFFKIFYQLSIKFIDKNFLGSLNNYLCALFSLRKYN
jgi:hypothetical protein